MPWLHKNPSSTTIVICPSSITELGPRSSQSIATLDWKPSFQAFIPGSAKYQRVAPINAYTYISVRFSKMILSPYWASKCRECGRDYEL